MAVASRGPAVFAGLCIGLLLGLVLGLSASPVVSVVVGALVTAAAAYWNLWPGAAESSTSPAPAIRALAAGVLCVGCIVGLLGGLYLRARDAFRVTPAQQVQQWTAAGYPEDEARALGAYQLTGLLGKGYDATPGEGKAATPMSTVLFSGSTENCDKTNPDDFAGAVNLRTAFANAGGSWRSMADAVGPFESAQQLTILRTAWQLACER